MSEFWAEWGTLAYLGAAAWAFFEGETFVLLASAAGRATGLINPWWLMLSVWVGSYAGDQLWFYMLRGRIHWLDRFPRLGKYREIVSARVHSHESMMLLASRFLPGLRTAIPIACAYAGVRPLKFTVLNMISALAWAGTIMLFVKTGSSALGAFGLTAWWGPLVPAVIVILFFRWLGRRPGGERPTVAK